MKVLVACEYSGTVRDAFRAKGHNAWSCDLLPSTGSNEFHIKGDVNSILGDGWDLMIAHPPCTHLAVSGARWFKDKQVEQQEALEFVRTLLEADIPKIALENPVSIISSRIRKPDQIVQPWMFGDPYEKTTCLWLKNLPPLIPTKEVIPESRTVFKSGKSHPSWYSRMGKKDRSLVRSKTFPGFALAMSEQWG